MQIDGDRTQYVYRLQKILADKITTPTSHYLDIGCGPGYVLRHVAPQVTSAIGVDFDPSEVERARANGCNAQVGDAQALPFPSQSFDAVTCYSTLTVLPKPETAISEIARVLKDDGRAVIHFTAAIHPNSVYWKRWYKKHREIKVTTFTLTGARATLARYGFEEIESHSLGITDLPGIRSGFFHRGQGPDLDYRLSQLPGLRAFASHHIIVVRKSKP